MPASHRSALLALAAVALCACKPDARAQPVRDPATPPETPLACAGPSDAARPPYCKAAAHPGGARRGLRCAR